MSSKTGDMADKEKGEDETAALPPPLPAQPKAFVFDLLTGLMDSWSLWNKAAGSPYVGKQWRLSYLWLTFGTGKYKPYEQLVRRAADATRAAGERLPADAPDKLFELWQQGGLKPWPETIETLTLLRERHPNAKFGVFTNCSAELGHIAAKACQSDKFQFDAVLTAEEAGFYKPRKETRRAILKLMGLNMHDCKETVFVAGSFLDVEGPLRDGMCVLWNNHAKMQAPPGVKPHREQHTLNGALQEYLREPA
ncbi:hypothetical protein EMMF5_006473 [Cystobasidiomycetes sp. EMM_F5]